MYEWGTLAALAYKQNYSLAALSRFVRRRFTWPATVPAATKDGITPELVAQSLSRRPIILIGDVGVGKTTFIRNLIKVDAAPEFENAVTLYIDLGPQATLTAD